MPRAVANVASRILGGVGIGRGVTSSWASADDETSAVRSLDDVVAVLGGWARARVGATALGHRSRLREASEGEAAVASISLELGAAVHLCRFGNTIAAPWSGETLDGLFREHETKAADLVPVGDSNLQRGTALVDASKPFRNTFAGHRVRQAYLHGNGRYAEHFSQPWHETVYRVPAPSSGVFPGHLMHDRGPHLRRRTVPAFHPPARLTAGFDGRDRFNCVTPAPIEDCRRHKEEGHNGCQETPIALVRLLA